jgi:D-arabinose 1-dehydrogenase-like Zn-dependent alcohol dehydrogenase
MRSAEQVHKEAIGSGYAFRQLPALVSVDDPHCPDAGVIIEVAASGLCRSDWHAWAGHEDILFPHVPGHELAGVVFETGSDVRRWSVGDRVTVEIYPLRDGKPGGLLDAVTLANGTKIKQ